MNEPHKSVGAIFDAAIELPPERRAAHVRAACAGDDLLRQRVEALLRAHDLAGTFMDSLAVDPRRETAVVKPAGAEQPGDRIGRYKLLQQIGEGGCGLVYMAEQEEPVRRRVALKVIKLGMDTKSVIARFEAERQALAMMDHPNIAKVLDAGATDTGRPYFVMELVRSIKITEYCDDNNLPTGERLRLLIQVCQAIQHAHQKGIIHRDLKPSNILVTINDGVAVPKVIDFGIAKATQGRLTDQTLFTAFEQFIGTPAYMSPEQAVMTSLDIDTRSDIYSLGVLFYELLTGRTPFDAQELLASGMEEMRRTIREKEPPRPSTRLSTMIAEELTTTAKRRHTEPVKLIHQLRGDLDWIVMKCLEKERARRYETANGLATDIQRHLSNEPVLARPPSTAYKLQKAWRRNTVVLTAVTAVAAALVLGLTVSSWQAVRATKARQAAKQEAAFALKARNKALEAQTLADRERERADQQRANAERNLYLANMNLLQSAWEQNNISRVSQLLEETAAYPQRGFEWYYWQRQVHLELATLRGHMEAVLAVAFSPDGQRIVTGSWDHSAKVWDAASGKELLTLKGGSQVISSVAFSPDGQRIVTGSAMSVAPPDGPPIVTRDAKATVWDAASGKELLTIKGHSNDITSVAFSPDGQRIVTGSDHTAKVWEAASGKELLTLKGHSDVVVSVAFSPDGQRVVTGGYDQTARVWDTASGKELLTLKGHGQVVTSVAFSPDGRRVTGSDGTAKVWDAASGKELLTLKGGHLIGRVAFSPDGRWIVTGGAGVPAEPANVWDAASGEELFALKGHLGGISSVAFSPDGKRIVTGSSDRTAKVWEVTSDRELLTLRGHTWVVSSVAFSPDGQRIATAGYDGTARLWEVASGKELFTLKGQSRYIRSVAFSPDGRRVVTDDCDQTTNVQTARVWDVASGKELLTLKGQSPGEIEAVAFSPNGERIVTAGYDGTVKLWEAASGKELLTLKGHSQSIYSVAFSPDGQRICHRRFRSNGQGMAGRDAGPG